MRKFYEIKDEMDAEHKQHLKALKEAYDRSIEELKRQEAVYDKLVADRSKEILELDTKKKGIIKDFDTLRLDTTRLLKEKVDLENKVNSLRITLAGEERAFKDKIELFEKEKKKVADDRLKEKELTSKIRSECEVEKMTGQAKEKNADRILAQAKAEKDEALRIRADADKQIEESKTIREEVVKQLTGMAEDKKKIASHEDKHKADIDFIEKEKNRLDGKSKSLEALDAELKRIAKTQEDERLSLDCKEADLAESSEKFKKLVKLNKMEGKIK